jgi:cytidylate kinase
MSQPSDLLDSPPRHGFQGDRALRPRPDAPLGLSVAISRESGARGGTIGRLAGKRLGWQVYDQDLLEFMVQDSVARQGLLDSLSPACVNWVEGRIAELQRLHDLRDESVLHLARLVLALAAQGDVVLIGRGTGCILPRETTLNVRVIAPLQERIAYMSQWLRLPTLESADRVKAKDERRAEFLTTHFKRSPTDVLQYDMILNTGQLGEEACAELVACAARLRWPDEGDRP